MIIYQGYSEDTSSPKRISSGVTLTGCDTTPAFFRKGKRTGCVLMKMKETELESLKVFIEENSSVIAESGERFLLKLYGETTERSLD